MKIVKICVRYQDSKYGNGHYSLSAISVDAAVKYLTEKFDGLEDKTVKYFEDNPYQLDQDDKVLKYFTHTQPRFDEDGGWDYPRESEISLYWEEVIE